MRFSIESFFEMSGLGAATAMICEREITERAFALWFSIDVHNIVPNGYSISWKADHTFDIVFRCKGRKWEVKELGCVVLAWIWFDKNNDISTILNGSATEARINSTTNSAGPQALIKSSNTSVGDMGSISSESSSLMESRSSMSDIVLSSWKILICVKVMIYNLF